MTRLDKPDRYLCINHYINGETNVFQKFERQSGTRHRWQPRIGAAIARRLAADGADVALTYVHGEEQAHSVVAEIEAKGGRAVAIKADNRDAEAIDRAVDEAVAAFGRLDILVNSAGIWRAAPIDTLSLADFDETMSVNLRAPL